MVKLGKNARSVSIVGVGCTPFKDFETHPETQGIGEGEAFGYAALEAIADAGLEPRDVDFFYHGSANPYLVGDCITPQHAGGRLDRHARQGLRPPLRGLLHRLRCS